MGETGNTGKAPKNSFWKGLKAEYQKIIWPDQKTLQKQTAAVISSAVVLGLIIAVMDTFIVYMLHFII